MNGIEVNADVDEFYDLVIGVAEGRMSKAAVAVFLRRTRHRPPRLPALFTFAPEVVAGEEVHQ